MKKGMEDAGEKAKKVVVEEVVKPVSKITKRMMEGDEPHHDEL
jgi:hypothetical protein